MACVIIIEWILIKTTVIRMRVGHTAMIVQIGQVKRYAYEFISPFQTSVSLNALQMSHLSVSGLEVALPVCLLAVLSGSAGGLKIGGASAVLGV